MSVKRPKKILQVMEMIGYHLDNGYYLDTRHAVDRKFYRNITRPEVLYVLRNGYHEKRKDYYEAKFHAWNYAVRGKTLDKRDLRVVVSFEGKDLLIITAIVLNK